MKSEKSRWVRPELTVLVRNKPEEAVLDWCKEMVYLISSPGPAYSVVGCYVFLDTKSCEHCMSQNRT